MRAFLVAALVLSGAALAGLGDGFGGGATATAGAGAGASVTYPRVDVQVGGYVSITPTVEGGAVSSYSVTAGALPDGLSLNASTGAITGVVTTTALFTTGVLGEHTVAVTAAGLDIAAPVTINVYGADIPNPESLVSFRSAQQSGSNFTDDILGGTTWTLGGGVVDPTLTDTESPLGYSHNFTGAQWFTDNGNTLTKQSSNAHVASAVLMRTTGLCVPFSIGVTAPRGFYSVVSATRGVVGGNLSSLVEGALLNDAWNVRFTELDSGVKFLDAIATRGGVKETTESTTSTFGIGAFVPQVAGNPGSSAANCTTTDIAQVAYWPRNLDSTQRSTAAWCLLSGISLEDCDGTDQPSGAAVTITPTAPAYERPVTCTGSYTLTGATTNASLVTWYAYPDGATGECTGTSTYSCAVAVSPASAGEGVETISITATHADGSQVIARQDVGFYVTGARDCFLSQSIDGLSNTTNADNDAVTTWVNLISSDRNITQGTAGSRPTVQEGVGSGVYVQPLVRFDGGDFLCDDTAADHVGYHDGTDFHVNVVAATTSTNPAKISHLFTTRNTTATTTLGMALTFDDTSANDACHISIGDGSSNIILGTCSASALVSGKYHEIAFTLDDDAGGGTDGVLYGNGSSLVTPTRSGSYSASAPTSALCLGNESGGGASSLTGDIFAAVGYASALSSTQRGINTAVTTWALGNTLPVNP